MSGLAGIVMIATIALKIAKIIISVAAATIIWMKA
jgi:hypothetical protein